MYKIVPPILLSAVLFGGGWLWSGGRLEFFTDRSAPELTLTKTGGGSKRMSFAVTGTDVGIGIATFRATVSQEGKEFEISKESFVPLLSNIEKSFEIEPKGLGLVEGKALVSTELTDGAFAQKQTAKTIEILIDYSPPTVAVVSQQFTANQGGAEFVLYRVGGGDYVRTGVTIGDLFFRGYPGTAFDERLAAYPDVHGVLLALPLGFDSNKEKIRVLVEDASGNIAQTTLDFPVKPLNQVAVDSKLSLSFLEKKIPDLVESYESRTNERVDQSDNSENAQIERFRLINETYRRKLQQEMFALIDKSAPTRLWSGVFSRPIPGSTTSLFGEQRTYALDGKHAGGSLHEGLDLASIKNDSVHAVNAGIVALSGEFGIYGNAVLIDHGTGLFSLYGHLSSNAVAAGEKVAKDQEIGRTGATGLAGGDHLHFEYRVGHVSVNPIEWWDAKWIADNIDGKITEFIQSFAAR